MRQLLISLLSLGLILGLWAIFSHNSEEYISEAAYECQNGILPLIESGDWELAYNNMKKQYKIWNKYRNYALFFYSAQDINETERTFLKTIMYIKAKDLSNSSGELCSLKAQLYSIVQKDKPSLQNIV